MIQYDEWIWDRFFHINNILNCFFAAEKCFCISSDKEGLWWDLRWHQLNSRSLSSSFSFAFLATLAWLAIWSFQRLNYWLPIFESFIYLRVFLRNFMLLLKLFGSFNLPLMLLGYTLNSKPRTWQGFERGKAGWRCLTFRSLHLSQIEPFHVLATLQRYSIVHHSHSLSRVDCFNRATLALLLLLLLFRAGDNGSH